MQAAAASAMTKFPAAARPVIWLKGSRLKKARYFACGRGRSENPALYVKTLFEKRTIFLESGRHLESAAQDSALMSLSRTPILITLSASIAC
jgi:hypothetical protein